MSINVLREYVTMRRMAARGESAKGTEKEEEVGEEGEILGMYLFVVNNLTLFICK